MDQDWPPTRADILRRLSRIERHPDVLESLLGYLAQRAGQNVEAVVSAEASSIYADALRVPSFTTLEKAWIRCRCDVARLAVIEARPGSPVALTLEAAREDLKRLEHHIRAADAEVLGWICARLRARLVNVTGVNP